jgi:cytochrome c oxidase subunit 2
MRIAALIMLAAWAATLTGCGGDQSVLDARGQSAVHLKHLIIWIVALCSVIWAAVIVALIWALFRHRDEEHRSNATTERRMTSVVAASVGLTVIIIAGFTVASFLTTRALGEAEADDLTIKVSGEQWWWRVTYLKTGAGASFETANEIHIPVGRAVRLQLEAADVIHSFWVPSLAGKQDLIPGRSNELTIRANRAGVYRGQCAEFCGLQHSHMAIRVVAEPVANFDRWAEAQGQTAASPSDPEAEAGKAVFSAKPCAACHTVRGTDAVGTAGPDLTHIASRGMIAAGLYETTRGSLAAWIADPQTLKPGNNMPMVPLSSDELRQVSAYLASLK